MKSTHLVLILTCVVLVAGFSPHHAEASSILLISDTSGGSANCDNSQAISATNCGAGFTTAANSSSILFSGSVGGFSIGNIILGGNQPGSGVAGNVQISEINVLHTAGTGNLQIDFGGNNFSLPAGPGLFLSASDSGTWGQSQASDMQSFTAWGKADNTLTVPGGTAVAVAPGCVPGAGLTTSCSASTLDVAFVRGAGNYSLTGRQLINLSTLDTLGSSYSATVAANSQPTTVPEPTSLVLLGTGMLLLTAVRRVRK